VSIFESAPDVSPFSEAATRSMTCGVAFTGIHVASQMPPPVSARLMPESPLLNVICTDPPEAAVTALPQSSITCTFTSAAEDTPTVDPLNGCSKTGIRKLALPPGHAVTDALGSVSCAEGPERSRLPTLGSASTNTWMVAPEPSSNPRVTSPNCRQI